MRTAIFGITSRRTTHAAERASFWCLPVVRHTPKEAGRLRLHFRILLGEVERMPLPPS